MLAFANPNGISYATTPSNIHHKNQNSILGCAGPHNACICGYSFGRIKPMHPPKKQESIHSSKNGPKTAMLYKKTGGLLSCHKSKY